MSDKSNMEESIRGSEKDSASGKKVIKTKPKENEKLVKSVVNSANIYRTASTTYVQRTEDATASRDATIDNVGTDKGGQRGGENAGPLETLAVALEGSSPRRSQRTNFGRKPNRYIALTNTVKKRAGKGLKSGAEPPRRTQSEKVTPKITTNCKKFNMYQSQHQGEMPDQKTE